MSFRVANDAAFADMFAASLELRLDQDYGFGESLGGGQHCGQYQGRGDEGDVHDKERQNWIDRSGVLPRIQGARSEQARVGALVEADARGIARGLEAQLHSDLAEAG